MWKPVELTDSCCLMSVSDVPRRNARLQPIGKTASNRPVHSSWSPGGRGQITSTSHFVPVAPHGDTCSKPMIMIPGTCLSPSAVSGGTFHYENDNGTLLEGQCLCQNRYLEPYLQWSMTALKSVPSEVEKYWLIHILTLCWEKPSSGNARLNTGTWPHGNVTAQHSHTGCGFHRARKGSGELALQNLISLRLFLGTKEHSAHAWPHAT